MHWTNLLRLVIGTCAASFLAALSVPAQAPRTDLQALDDAEAYRVYASLLSREWTVTAARATTLVFQQETATNWQCMPSGTPIETDWRVVMDNFRAANATVKVLRPGFPMDPPYIVVPRAAIDAAFTAASDEMMFGWNNFYKRYPQSGGIMFVSVPGFDAERKRAIVYMAHSCGSLCGGGMHHLLEKIDGRWQEARVPDLRNCIWDS
jgi:hypothetical protein